MVRTATITPPKLHWRREFGRKIRDARFLVGDDRFIVTFDSGKSSVFHGHRWRLMMAVK